MVCTRRDFFSTLTRTTASKIVRSLSILEKAVSASPFQQEPRDPGWTPPPGALPTVQFRSTCTHCTDCLVACPHVAIRRLGPEFGPDAGLPAIIPSESPCHLCEDMPCIAACEPGALLPVKPRDVNWGTAVIDLSQCYAAQGQVCDYCVTTCPLGTEAIRMNEQGHPTVNETSCPGCGLCAYLCPANAIEVEPNRLEDHPKMARQAVDRVRMFLNRTQSTHTINLKEEIRDERS